MTAHSRSRLCRVLDVAGADEGAYRLLTRHRGFLTGTTLGFSTVPVAWLTGKVVVDRVHLIPAAGGGPTAWDVIRTEESRLASAFDQLPHLLDPA